MEELSTLLEKQKPTKNLTVFSVAKLTCSNKLLNCLSICTETSSFQRESGVLACCYFYLLIDMKLFNMNIFVSPQTVIKHIGNKGKDGLYFVLSLLCESLSHKCYNG